MATIVVTGASGFIGRHLVPVLIGCGHAVIEAGRNPGPSGAPFVAIGDIGAGTSWDRALRDADAVVHLAGLAHRRSEGGDASFFDVNDAGVHNLAEACGAAGIRTLVCVSSIAARTAAAQGGAASAYGRSKLAGEAHVLGFSRKAGRVGIVLRPPLVYGPDAPGNWRALQRLAATGLPLPFGTVANRRSLCAVGNLCDAILSAVEAGMGEAASGVYEIADREIVSLTEIVTALRKGMDRPARLLSVPTALLRLGGRMTGNAEMVASLVDDMVLDPRPFMRAFDWSPKIATLSGIAESGREYAKAVARR